MKKNHPPLSEHSLPELLAAIQQVAARGIPAHQERALTQTLLPILARCQNRARPLQIADLQTIHGHWHVKRALEVAAAGGHHLLLVGPAGAGKALLARALPSLLPAADGPSPCREVASDISRSALLGEPAAPGEVTLAHGGVLLLRDLGGLETGLLTALTQTLRSRSVSFPGKNPLVVFPAAFLLVATVTPCPCGLRAHPVKACVCTAEQVTAHQQRIAEITSHLAIAVHVPIILKEEILLSTHPEESSAAVRQRVEAARQRQRQRYAHSSAPLRVNADLGTLEEIEQYCPLDATGRMLLRAALRQLILSPLQLIHVQAVARTIADLAGSAEIAAPHLAEAIQYLSRSPN